MNKVWIMLLLGVVTFRVDAYDGKYEGFELVAKDGVQEYELRSGKTKLPIDITTLVNQRFGISNDDGWVNPNTYALNDDGTVVVRGVYSSRNKEIIERISRCDYTNAENLTAADCGKYMLLVADPRSGDVVRLDTHGMPEFSVYDAFNSEVWKYDFDAYGCHIANPIKMADIDLDGLSEIFYVGGFGIMQLDKNESEVIKTFKTTLAIFNPEKSSSNVFRHELSYENFFDRSASEYLNKKSSYQVFTPYILEPSGHIVADDYFGKAPIKPAIRRYSKLFFKDFNKNDKLDILIWQREYISRLKSDPVKGFKLNKVVFQFFEEDDSGFVEKSISDETATQYLAEHDLTWRSGYPNTNLCRHRKSDDDPIIENYVINRKFNINDPVLER